jgi:hypothetical protein
MAAHSANIPKQSREKNVDDDDITPGATWKAG